jgi:hypothetical protein
MVLPMIDEKSVDAIAVMDADKDNTASVLPNKVEWLIDEPTILDTMVVFPVNDE